MKNRKLFSLLLALLLALTLVACDEKTKPEPVDTSEQITAPIETPAEKTEPIPPAGPVAEEVKGITIPEFSITVNGVAVDHVAMAAYPTYSVQATSVNSAGTESTTTYVGFAISDVLQAAGLTESYVWLEAEADDGYVVSFKGEDIMANTTLLAMTKDGSQFKNAPWFAPCTSGTTGDYLKGCVSILVNTVDEKPVIEDPEQPKESEGLKLTGETPEKLDRTEKVTFSDFSFEVNGNDVTNETLEGLRIYKITVVTENKNGELSESTYTGYVLSDVLDACGIEDYSSVKVIASDGYETELPKEQAESEYTLVAIEKDKETGEDGTIWVAPCSEASSRSYCKLVSSLVVE
ncbi:MAG: hypothetical protein GX924_04135 [Clostridiaceae bacterium]|nr:hypothetical protein [Clostridiaceae bacterium]